MTDSPDSTVGKVVYEDLVRLTFLTGRGLTVPRLMLRFLAAIRPRVPAHGLWLHGIAGVVAADATVGLAIPPAPDLRWRGMNPEDLPGGLIALSVAPEVVLLAAPEDPTSPRARDVLVLFARMLALAWQAERVSFPELDRDDYAAAKASFKRTWLTRLRERHAGNISACARASGLSRAALHEMLNTLGLRSQDLSGNPDSE